MRKITATTLRTVIGVLSAIVLAVVVLAATSVNSPKVSAAASTNLNFQARLLSNSGSVVPDGFYNVEFNLYNVASGGTAIWTETRDYNSNTPDRRVRVVNGYLTVNLGSVSTFVGTNIDWSQEKWLTMKVGGSGTVPAWDAEMLGTGSTRMKLTAVPEAFHAQKADTSTTLSKTSGAHDAVLEFATPTADTTFTLQAAAAGTYTVCTSANEAACSSVYSGSGGGGFTDDGTLVRLTAATDRVTLGSATDLSAQLAVDGNSDQIQLKVQAHSTQTSNLLVLEQGDGTDGTDVLTVSNAGDLVMSGALTVNGNTTLGNANTDTLTIQGTAVAIPNNLNFDSNTLFIDATNDKVALGTTTTTARLAVQSTTEQLRLSYDASNYVAFTTSSSGDLTVSPSGYDTNFNSRLYVSQDAMAGGDGIIKIAGGLKATSGNVAALYNSVSIAPDSASTANNWGSYSSPYSSSANLAGANIGAYYGLPTYNGTGSVNSLIGMELQAVNSSTGTIASAYGVKVNNPTNGGTITNNYGMYIGNQTAGTSDYGLYIQGADTYALYSAAGANYFGGAVTANSTLSVTGNISGTGTLTMQNTANSETAVQVRNAAGTSVVGVATTNANLLSNSSFETNASNWGKKGNSSVTLSSSTDFAKYGSRSLKITTTANANDGALAYYPFKPSTAYAISFWARSSSGTVSSVISLGRADNGTDTNCLATQTLTTTWTQYACNFTTGSTINDNAHIYIKQSDSTSRTFYIDGVTLVLGSTGADFVPPATNLQVEGLNNMVTLNGNGNAELGQWQTNHNNLGSSRYETATVTANGYIYVIGGHDDGGAVNSVMYAKLNADGSTGAWTTNSANLPSARTGASAVVLNGYLYVIGGNNSGAQSSVYYGKLNLDGSISSWTTSANALSNSLYYGSAFTYNGYIYYAGGYDGSNRVTTVYRSLVGANGANGTWSTGTALSDNRARAATVVANGYVYIIGGENSGGTRQSTVLYSKLNSDGTNTSWNSTSALSSARKDLSAVLANGYIYVLGGNTGTSANSTIVAASKVNGDGTIGDWINVASLLPNTRAMHSSIAVNGNIYVIGGQDDAANRSQVWYASTARVRIGGSLDLLGLTNVDYSEINTDFSSGSLGGELLAGNSTIVGTLNVQGAAVFRQNVGVYGQLTVQGAARFNGDLTIGDASTDALTITGTSVATPNNLNFDSNTLFIDAANNRVGIGKNDPGVALDVTGVIASSSKVTVSSAADDVYNLLFSSYAPNLTAGHMTEFIFGKSESNYNRATIGFYYVGNSDLNNSMNFGFYGKSDIFKLNGHGNAGLGTDSNTIAARLHAISTTEQLRLGYDNTNYTSFTTSSGGDLTVAPSGGDTSVTGTLSVSGQVNIGTSDTTATLLVLDTKTDAEGALAGTNGAMYYNSNANKFRCYQNGGWTDCIASSSGVTTVGTFSDTTSYANGAQISSNTITFGAASATNPGLMTAAAQIFAGDKQFNGLVGVGTTTSPSAKLEVLATTTQFRTSYDASNYTNFTTSSGGDLTIAPSGGDATISGTGTFTGASVTVGANAQLGSLFLYDGSNNTTKLTPAATTSNLEFILPAGYGADNDCVKGDGAGGLEFASCIGGGGLNIGTINTGTPNGNGAQISGTDLIMQYATASVPGLVSIGTQTFAGDKQFNGLVGVGTTTTPSAKLQVLGTTEQLRLSYDASNQASFTVSSGGDLTVAPSGGDTSLTGTLSVSGQVNIGTSNTTATLLVLDTKTDAEGALAGTAGAMYYNSNAGKFRCYQGSAWTDCIGGGSTYTAGTFNTTPTAKGLSITGTEIFLHAADASNPGAVTIADQSFAGAKTFTGNLIVQGDTTIGNGAGDTLSIVGTAVSLTNSLNIDANTLYVDSSADKVAIGTTSTNAKLNVLSTTEQLRTSYDASNYTSFTTSSGGDLTIAPSGGDASLTGTFTVAGAGTTFQIQSASAADTLFVASATTNTLKVGNSTGTNTATTLFVLDNANTDPTTNVVEGAMYYNSSTHSFMCYQGNPAAWAVCGGSSSGGLTRRVTLVPEFPGAVFSPTAGGANSGTMNADYDSTNFHNYYEWSTAQTSAQSYDIIIRTTIPSESTGVTNNSFKLFAYANTTTSSQADITFTMTQGATTCVAATSALPGTASTWVEATFTASSCPLAANDTVTIKITVKSSTPSGTTYFARVGELRYEYTN